MARPERIRLDVPANVGVGAPIHVLALRDKTVQVSGPFVGAVLVEGSIDAENFEPLGAALTAPGFVLVAHAVALLRVRVAELTSGRPRAIVAGFDFRAV